MVTPLLIALLLSQSRDLDSTINAYEAWNVRQHGSNAVVRAPLKGEGCFASGATSGNAVVTVGRAGSYTGFKHYSGYENRGGLTTSFDNAAFGKSASGTGVAPTVVADSPLCGLAPDGSQTADLVTFQWGGDPAVAGLSQIDIVAATSPQQATVSSNVWGVVGVWVKNVDSTTKYINFSCTGCSAGDSLTRAIEPGAWTLLKHTQVNNTTGPMGARLRLSNLYAGSSASARLCVWGGTSNMFAGSTAPDGFLRYVPNTGLTPIYETALTTCGANSAYVSPKGIEIWSASTNLITQSTDLSNAAWASIGTPATVTGNACSGPDGTVSMLRLVSASTTDGRIFSGMAATGNFATGSSWVKNETNTPADMSVIVHGNAATVTACSCWVSEGTCTGEIQAGNCSAFTRQDPGRMVRLAAIATTDVTPTSWDFLVHSGRYNVSWTNVECFGGAQLEETKFPTPYIPTSGLTATRSATSATISLPAGMHTTNRWCIGATGTKSIYTGGVSPVLLAVGSGSANSMDFFGGPSSMTFRVFDSLAASKQVTDTGYSALPAGSAHRWIGCNDAGNLSLYRDGVLVSGAPVGAGTGLWNATQATMAVGTEAGNYWDGWIRDVSICPNDANPKHCN